MGTRVFRLLQKGISSVWYFVSSLAPYGSPLLIFFHTRTLCSDALVNILPSKHKQDAKIAVDSNLLLNHICTLIGKASFSKYFTQHMPGFIFSLGVQAGPFTLTAFPSSKKQAADPWRTFSLPPYSVCWLVQSSAGWGRATHTRQLCCISASAPFQPKFYLGKAEFPLLCSLSRDGALGKAPSPKGSLTQAPTA